MGLTNPKDTVPKPSFAKPVKKGPAAKPAAQISPEKIDKAMTNSRLKHPGDKPRKPSAPKRKPGPLPQLSQSLYLRGIEKATVQVGGPKQTLEEFKAYCDKHDFRMWEAMQVLLNIADGRPK